MEDSVIDGSFHSALYWTRLNENNRVNPNAAQVLKVKANLIKTLKPSSIVYKRQRRLPGPLNAQLQNFQLAPLTGFQDVELELSDGNTTGKVLSDLNAWSVKDKTSRFQTNRPSTNPKGHELFQKPTDKDIPPQHLHQDRQSSSRQSDHGSLGTSTRSTSSTPLPVFGKREPTSVFLFRRPIIETPIPLNEDDELFVALTKTIELKALPFKKPADSYKFYERHFPLILTGTSKETERCNTPSRRSRTPESAMTILINRQRALNMRLVDHESLMEQLEKETDDCEFVTELNDPIFNPTKWSWNKIDVGGLRRRYTIDASLNEMQM